MSEDERPEDAPDDQAAPPASPPAPHWEPVTERLKRSGPWPPPPPATPEEAALARLSAEALSKAVGVQVTGTLGTGEVVTYRLPDGGEGLGLRDADGVVRPLHGVAEPRVPYEGGERPPPVPDPWQHGPATIAANVVTYSLLGAIHDGAAGRDWDDSNGQLAPTHRTVVNRSRKKGSGESVYVSLRGDDGSAVPTTETIPFLWERVHALGDWASDALCVCLALAEQHERQGRSPDGAFWVTADAILDARGVKRMTRRGEPGNWSHGHRREDRLLAGQSLGQLQNLWLKADVRLGRTGSRQTKRLQVESRALAITDKTSQQELEGGAVFLAARVVFGEWAPAYWEHGLRQTALLARQALSYHAYNEQAEKRLAKYFAFQFKLDARHGRTQLPCVVETLLRQAELGDTSRFPQRVRERLEKALARLAADGVIAGWAYADPAAADALPARGWLPAWRLLTVLVTLPEGLLMQYRSLRPTPPPPALAAP